MDNNGDFRFSHLELIFEQLRLSWNVIPIYEYILHYKSNLFVNCFSEVDLARDFYSIFKRNTYVFTVFSKYESSFS